MRLHIRLHQRNTQLAAAREAEGRVGRRPGGQAAIVLHNQTRSRTWVVVAIRPRRQKPLGDVVRARNHNFRAKRVGTEYNGARAKHCSRAFV